MEKNFEAKAEMILELARDYAVKTNDFVVVMSNGNNVEMVTTKNVMEILESQNYWVAAMFDNGNRVDTI